MVLTDDVYATFADDFVSVFATCPQNTILVYSFSKYFGATGWRLGVIALHENNSLDAKISALPRADRVVLDERYGSLAVDPHQLKFIDRMVADSRSVALNHTAVRLSTPQQVQMALFSLFALMDERDTYKQVVKGMIRRRYQTLYRELGFEAPDDPNAVGFYAVLDLEILGPRRYGRDFVDWRTRTRTRSKSCFGSPTRPGLVAARESVWYTVPLARISLANLEDEDYVRIGRVIGVIMQEYVDEYQTHKA